MKDSLRRIMSKKNAVLSGIVLAVIFLAYASSKYVPSETVRMAVLGTSFVVEITFVVYLIYQLCTGKSKGEAD